MSITKPKYVVSTDLDGTLLDHHDYDYSAAEPALGLCRQQGIPVVLNTSKNSAETISLWQELSLDAPIAVENGSALYWPAENRSQVFGSERETILSFITRVRRDYGFDLVGFNDWSVDEIIEHTGLSEDKAELATQKQYSEPFLWRDSKTRLAEFTRLARVEKLDVLKGGRFYHLQGQVSKATPLHFLKQSVYGEDCSLICLGDNHNDVAMLNIADIPICVRSPVADFPPIESQFAPIYTKGYGPDGWNEAILALFKNV